MILKCNSMGQILFTRDCFAMPASKTAGYLTHSSDRYPALPEQLVELLLQINYKSSCFPYRECWSRNCFSYGLIPFMVIIIQLLELYYISTHHGIYKTLFRVNINFWTTSYKEVELYLQGPAKTPLSLLVCSFSSRSSFRSLRYILRYR